MKAPALHPLLVWQMTRPGFLALTMVGCILGISVAAACGHGPHLPAAAATLVRACLAHAAGNVLNDYHDALNGADAANTQGIAPYTGGSRLIQQGTVTAGQTLQVFQVLSLLLAGGGLWLAAISTGWVLALGLAGFLLLWAYSAPPLALMTRGWGEAVIAVVWSLVVIGADAVQRGTVFVIPAATSVSFGLLAANILLINGFPDAQADASVGKRTLVVILGPARAAWLYLLVGICAHAWLLAGVWLFVQPQAALWGLVSWPISLAAAGLLIQRTNQPRSLRPALVLTIMAALVHGLAMAAGYALM